MSQVHSVGNMANANANATHTTVQLSGNTNAAVNNVSDEVKLSVSEAVQNINEALNVMKNDERQFNVDEDLGRVIVKIVDSDTKEVVKQIPTEDAVNLSKKMQEIVGLIFG